MKKILLACSMLALIPAATTAQNQLSDSLKTEIRKVSDQMFHEGNPYYLELDAICDGYLALNKPYKFGGDHELLYLNETRLPLCYVAKRRAFAAENYRMGAGREWTRNDGISLNDIFHAESSLRRFFHFTCSLGSGYEGRTDKINKEKVIKHLVSMIAADHLVDTAMYFDVHFNHVPELTINDGKIDQKYAWKYAVALKADGFDIIEDIGNIRYNNNYKKQPW